MAEQTTGHNAKLKWAHSAILKPDLTDWTVNVEHSVAVSVYGACPACGGSAWGPPLPNVGEDTVRAVEEITREAISIEAASRQCRAAAISAECHCGSEHGKAGADGCGRFWVVEVGPRP